jgi:hypothetical protein
MASIWANNRECRKCLNEKRRNKELNMIVTDLISVLPGNSFVNTIQHAIIEEAAFSIDPTDAPINWLGSDHVICVYCRSMFLP